MNTHIVPSHRLFMWPTYQVLTNTIFILITTFLLYRAFEKVGHTIELHHILPPQIIRTYVDPITKVEIFVI